MKSPFSTILALLVLSLYSWGTGEARNDLTTYWKDQEAIPEASQQLFALMESLGDNVDIWQKAQPNQFPFFVHKAQPNKFPLIIYKAQPNQLAEYAHKSTGPKAFDDAAEATD